MGYRVRIGKIAKTEQEKYKDKNYDELCKLYGGEEDEGYFYAYTPPGHTELYEIGKQVSFEQGRTPFYSFDVYEETENEFDILSKEGLLYIINSYHDDVREYYKEKYEQIKLIIGDEKEGSIATDKNSAKFELRDHFRRMISEWSNQYGVIPYRLDDRLKDGFISGSWLKEYGIFNLTYIYKTFDWENDFLIYSGW